MPNLKVVNVAALQTAAEALVGPQVTNGIMQLYQFIDRAMKDGYELGMLDAEKNIEDRISAAFDNGFEHGYADAQDNSEEVVCARSWDEGYLEGVGDARARPVIADSTVVDIINTMTAEALNGECVIEGAYTGRFVRGSGDEQEAQD